MILTKEQILSSGCESYKAAYYRMIERYGNQIEQTRQNRIIKAQLEEEAKAAERKAKADKLLFLRSKTGLEVEEFCAKFGFREDLYRKWESGLSHPLSCIPVLIERTIVYELSNDTVLPYREYMNGQKAIMFLLKSSGLSKIRFCSKYHINPSTLCGWVSGRVKPNSYVISMIENLIAYEEEFGYVGQYTDILN